MRDDPPDLPRFAEIYDRHYDAVCGYVRCRVAGAAAADDVVSRVFERALDRLDGYDPRRAPVAAWLFAIARSAVVDHYRALRGRAGVSLDAAEERPSGELPAEEVLAGAEERRALAGALALLDDREREILALKFGGRLTNRDIAAHLELGESHVAVLVYRAVRRLRGALEGER
jgi:RNA polymerase sigma factor (sigma-70 family)